MQTQTIVLDVDINDREKRFLRECTTPLFKGVGRDEIYQGDIYHTDMIRECKKLKSLVNYLDKNEIVLFLVKGN